MSLENWGSESETSLPEFCDARYAKAIFALSDITRASSFNQKVGSAKK